jgi:hypothetical protein
MARAMMIDPDVLSQRTDHGTDEVHAQGEDEQGLTADLVAELAVDRKADGLGEQECRDHPAHLVDATQLADDGRQSGGEDRLAQ